MKKIFQTVFCVLLATAGIGAGHAQSPEAFQYQAVISEQGNAVSNQDVKVRFNIRENSATGTVVYTEVHEAKTNVSGMVYLQIGKGAVEEGEFSGINWAGGNMFCQVEVDKGHGYVAHGTQQLLSVPYAKYATLAGQVNMTSPNGTKWNVTINENGELTAEKITE